MNNRFHKYLVLAFFIMVFTVSCTKAGGSKNTIDVVKIEDSSFVVTKDSTDFKRGNIIDLNFPENSEELEIGNIYKIKIGQGLTKSLPPQATVEFVEENLGSHKFTTITLEDGIMIREIFPEKTHLIDVRTEEEYSQGHVPDSINIPVDRLEEEIEDLITNTEDIVIVYCRSGSRSKQAADVLSKLGYSLVFDAGGINSYSGELVK